MKKIVFKAIRSIHLQFFKKELPDNIAIYFHEVPEEKINSLIRLVDFFNERGYDFVNINSFLKNDGRKKVYLSFDDNYKSWLSLAETLSEIEVPVMFYTNTLPFRNMASLEVIKDYYENLRISMNKPLSSQELKKIMELGHTIGAHSHSHYNLNALNFQDAKKEIQMNKTLLENILEIEVEHFSYPFGMKRHFNEKLRMYCIKLGFKTIANAIPGMQYEKKKKENLYRTLWDVEKNFDYNFNNLCIDGRLFVKLTGRSVIG